MTPVVLEHRQVWGKGEGRDGRKRANVPEVPEMAWQEGRVPATGLLGQGDLGENRALGPGVQGPGEPSRAQVMQTSWGTCTQAGGAHVSITGLPQAHFPA